jgi:hypothetical protein
MNRLIECPAGLTMNIQSETMRIQDFVDKGNYHAGINLAISAMNACRRQGDQSGVDHFLGLIKGIADAMVEEFGS